MPHYLGDIVVVTKEELVPQFFSTLGALQKKLQRYEKKNYGIKRAMLGGNGRMLLVDFDSLDKDIQSKLVDPRKPQHILENYYKKEQTATEFYQDFQYPNKTYLRPTTVDKLIINASVYTALVKLEIARENERISKNNSIRGIVDTLYSDVHSFNATLLERYDYKHTLSANLQSFKRQYKRFKETGYFSLIKDAKGTSKTNALKRTDKTNKLLNDLFAGREYKPTATEVAKQYEAFLGGYISITNEKTGEIYEPKDFKTIGTRTITSFLSTWESKIGTHAKRSGDRQVLMQDFIPYESMEKPTLSGSIISIDDRQPPFEYEKGKRMWWYIGIDLASEAIVAWAYGKTKEELIRNFYKNLVVNHNNWNIELPNELECESSLNSSFKNTFLEDGAMFQKVNIHANSARSKRIERFFKDLRYEIEKEQTGWIARPFARAEANQASSDKKVFVPYDQLVKQCFQNIVTWNNMPKKGTKLSRFDYFIQNQNPNLAKTNYKSFIKHLGTKTVTSCNAGIMNLQRSEWLLGDKGEIYTGEDLILLLKQVEGQNIDIYWLDDDKGNVMKAFIYSKNDGRYICEALAKPKSARASIEQTEDQQIARSLFARYRNTVTMYMQQQKNAIDTLSVIDNRPKTVSSSFSIAGLDQYIPSTEAAEAFDDQEEEFEYVPNNNTTTAVNWRNTFNN